MDLSRKSIKKLNLKAYRDEVLLIVLLKTVFENLNLVKSYDKKNLNVFVFSLWKKYMWGLVSFSQYICLYDIQKVGWLVVLG